MNLVNRGIWAAVTGSFLAFPAAFGLSAKEKKMQCGLRMNARAIRLIGVMEMTMVDFEVCDLTALQIGDHKLSLSPSSSLRLFWMWKES